MVKGIVLDDAPEFRCGRRELIAGDGGRGAGRTRRASDLLGQSRHDRRSGGQQQGEQNWLLSIHGVHLFERLAARGRGRCQLIPMRQRLARRAVDFPLRALVCSGFIYAAVPKRIRKVMRFDC